MLSKKMKILLLLLIAGAISWVYKVYDRHCEIQEFFTSFEDLIWARKYLDKMINLCDSPWEETIIIKSSGKDVYLSPSRRYEIQWNNRSGDDAYFLIVDTKNDQSIKNSPILSRLPSVQWAQGERFLIFSPAITLDEWWVPLKIFINDTVTGKTIYFGKSKYYECGVEDLEISMWKM